MEIIENKKNQISIPRSLFVINGASNSLKISDSVNLALPSLPKIVALPQNRNYDYENEIC